ncbi:unnamed protein product [Rotaria sp. Silwood2]|nr:unnamed protein product [Rotaria sp. Silwood2]
MAAAVATQKMFDTGLFKSYSTTTFNQLGRVNRIIECHGEGEQSKRIESIIDNLAHVFIKHKMHDLLGVSLGSVQQLMEHYGHNCVRNTHWTIIQNDDGSISKAIGGCICGIDC